MQIYTTYFDIAIENNLANIENHLNSANRKVENKSYSFGKITAAAKKYSALGNKSK